MLCGESRLLEEQQNDENAFVHYGISTYLVLRFAKIYGDEIKQQQKRQVVIVAVLDGWGCRLTARKE